MISELSKNFERLRRGQNPYHMVNIAYELVPPDSSLKEGLEQGLDAFDWGLKQIDYLETYTLWVVDHQIQLGLISKP